jgi:muramidase (phage lysozyme)
VNYVPFLVFRYNIFYNYFLENNFIFYNLINLEKPNDVKMPKKGVSAISGNTSPVVGEKSTYHVSDWYPDTPSSERNLKSVTWELFRKRSNGKFTTTNVRKKGDSSFTFGEASLGHTYRLEGYLYAPEGRGIIIIPKPNKISQISKVELYYIDDTKGSSFSFMERLRAKAYCINMFNKEVVFTLWEDDAKGAGHNAGNTSIETQKAKIDKNGVAVAEFMLTKALIKKAMKGEANTEKLEFYVTVEYYRHNKHATQNVEVENPYAQYYKPKPYQPPVIPKAKGSPAEQKPASQKEEKGIIDTAIDNMKELWDWGESKGTATKEKSPTILKPEGRSAVSVGVLKKEERKEEEKICKCEARVKAYMRMLRVGEGTGELIKSSKYNKETKKIDIVYIPNDFESGYTKLFGGDNFTKPPHNKNMSDHPHIKVLWYTKKNGEKVYSSAAGAYQVMGYTWSDNEMINKRKNYNIKDFSAEGQDKFCIVLFKYKRVGILDLIINGDIKEATEKYGSYEWASLPPGRYGQPIETMEKALELYNNFYQEELSGKSPLYLKKGFLKEFGYNCCEKDTSKSNSVNSLCGKSEIDLREKVKWQTQFDPKWGGRDRQMVACKKTCDDILINSGLKATSLLRLYQTAIENSEHSKLVINSQVSKEAIMYLDSELEKGHPVQVGVDHGLGYKIDNNADRSTDHFVVIIGRKCEGIKCYYLFYDVGTSYKEKGASDNNRLYFDKTDYSLRGKTVYNENFYTVTQIRKN